MGSVQDTLLRSADMTLTKLYISHEAGRDVMHSLGELGLMDFRDLNLNVSKFKREFTAEIKRWDTVERQLRFFQHHLSRVGLGSPFIENYDNAIKTPTAFEMDTLVEQANELESHVVGLNESEVSLLRGERELIEWACVLQETDGFFARARNHRDDIPHSVEDGDDAPLLQDVESNLPASSGLSDVVFADNSIKFLAGVIPRDRLPTFERVLWRALRGNLYLNQAEVSTPIFDPDTNEHIHKNVFIVFSHGVDTMARVHKIASALGANIYHVDENDELRRGQKIEVESKLEEMRGVLASTRRFLRDELSSVGKTWMVLVRKEKAVYENLNKLAFDPNSTTRKILIAEAWCPTSHVGLIRTTLQSLNTRFSDSAPPLLETVHDGSIPPTYIKTNKFTLAFQTIINAYGIPKYGEVNPGLPTIVTFPFLFAVMFGDFGHGLIMTLTALVMIFFELKMSRIKLDELLSMVFYGRYIMLLMGIFSLYTGLIYSDMFSKVMPLFPSMWTWPTAFQPGDTIQARRVHGYTYPLGLDWSWHDTENDLLFSNSYKMKMSILLGWAHMTFSLCLSYVNARHERNWTNVWGGFIPSMIFFQSIFGYLAFSIVYKWTVDWANSGKEPPSLLNMLINMFLAPGTVDTPLYSGQAIVQQILLVLALCCLPVMLIIRPYYLWRESQAHHGYHQLQSGASPLHALDDDAPETSTFDHISATPDGDFNDEASLTASHHSFDLFEELMHPIEFCLNCVSHTASYLRLWALSLAHQQLSIVLWNMTLGLALPMTGTIGVIALVCLFSLWFTLTVAVLCAMEGTSAMLHSLRLHWVEAMSKHFASNGLPFQPFSFHILFETESSD